MPRTIPKFPLRQLIDRNRDEQNGFGYDEFVRLLTLPRKRPTVHNIANIFNKNPRTVKGWVERFEEEKDNE